MSRCRETAGILFPKKCGEPAVGACSQCKKPICKTHSRDYWQSIACVSCLRGLIEGQPQQKQSQAHLRDDPYFYWYYVDTPWNEEAYGASDYRLFDDAGGADFGADDYGGWEGT
ncbi:MAG: hypothetical protein AAF928_18655 [Myxococcota bacterium]